MLYLKQNSPPSVLLQNFLSLEMATSFFQLLSLKVVESSLTLSPHTLPSTISKSCCLFLRGMDCYSRTQSEIQSLFCPLRGPHELDPSLPWLYFLPVSPSPSLFEPLVFWLFYKHAMFSPQGLKDYSSSYLETFPSWNPHN